MSESLEEANGALLCQKATRLRGESTEKENFWRSARWWLWLMTGGYWRDLNIGLLYVVLLISVFACGFQLAIWPCPRCGKVFGRSSGRCRHCGLPLWSQGESG